MDLNYFNSPFSLFIVYADPSQRHKRGVVWHILFKLFFSIYFKYTMFQVDRVLFRVREKNTLYI